MAVTGSADSGLNACIGEAMPTTCWKKCIFLDDEYLALLVEDMGIPSASSIDEPRDHSIPCPKHTEQVSQVSPTHYSQQPSSYWDQCHDS